MPDDIKVTYIKLLRERFGVTDSHIGEMMGVSQKTICKEINRLALNVGRGCAGGRRKWDKDGFDAWRHGLCVPRDVEEVVDEPVEDVCEECKPCEGEATVDYKYIVRAIPCEGDMTFVCNADDALETIRNLLGNAYAKITVSWELSGGGE